jgi:hypothetical protein
MQYKMQYKTHELPVFNESAKNTKPTLELASGAGFIRF